MNLLEIKKAGIVYFEKKLESKAYILKSGKIELRKQEGFFLERDNLSKKKILKAGDVFGFEDVYFGRERKERAVALENSQVICFEIEEFVSILTNNIKIGEKLLRSLAKRIKTLNDKIGNMSIQKEERLSSSIIDILKHYLQLPDYKKAKQVLQRMKRITGYNSISEIFEANLKASSDIEGVEEKLNYLFENFKNDDYDLLEYILRGMKKNIKDIETVINISYREIENYMKKNDDTKLIEKANRFLADYPESHYCSNVMFILIEVSEKYEMYEEAFSITEELEKKYLSQMEKEKVEEIKERLKK